MLNHIIVRLIVYYLAWTVFFFVLMFIFPETNDFIVAERNRVFTGMPGAPEPSPPLPPTLPPTGPADRFFAELAPSKVVPILMALVLTFVLSLPLTWIYRWTRKPGKHDQAFVQTLLVIPVAIALVVFLVKGSLALAFSLAGIVAAVRFRTTLKQPMDGVYMFMAIGIGLAAGTQLPVVAFLASVIFTTIVLGVWKSNYGAEPPVLSGWRIVPSGGAGRGRRSRDAS